MPNQEASKGTVSAQDDSGLVLGKSREEWSRREKAIKEVLAEAPPERQQLERSLQIIAQKALLILVLFVVCAIFDRAGADHAITLAIFLISAVIVLVVPFHSKPS